MKYIDEYRDRELISLLIKRIRHEATGNYRFMEVCGGHTAAIRRFGIQSMIPENIALLSGPGCPVCVTGNLFIDKAITFSHFDDVIITTFGDLIRVPGSNSSLEKEKSKGYDIRIVFSGLDALDIAKTESNKKIVFPGIGFETTAPGTAATIKEAFSNGLDNYYVLSSHKIMPPAIEEVIKDGAAIHGFICPGHVAAITGSSIFDFISEKYHLSCVVSGFEPVDILQSILLLIRQVNTGCPGTEIEYSRAVTKEGNRKARMIIEEVFELCDEDWRGFGSISSSGLKIRDKYGQHDAEKRIPINVKPASDNDLCICNQILRGIKTPDNCALYKLKCSPESPVGACMVSEEGTCNIYFRYGSKN